VAGKRERRIDHLEEAMSRLIQSQATLLQQQTALMQHYTALIQQQTAFLERLSETDRELAALRRQTDERFARIEEELRAIKAILLRHERILEGLPEAIREKIGFKPPSS